MNIGFHITFQVYPNPYTYLADGKPAKEPLYIKDFFEVSVDREKDELVLSCRYFRWVIKDLKECRTAIRQISLILGFD
jgi:hypothetical protein